MNSAGNRVSGQLRVRERVSPPFTATLAMLERKVTANISVQLGGVKCSGSKLPPCEASHQNANDVITYPLSGKKIKEMKNWKAPPPFPTTLLHPVIRNQAE